MPDLHQQHFINAYLVAILTPADARTVGRWGMPNERAEVLPRNRPPPLQQIVQTFVNKYSHVFLSPLASKRKENFYLCLAIATKMWGYGSLMWSILCRESGEFDTLPLIVRGQRMDALFLRKRVHLNGKMHPTCTSITSKQNKKNRTLLAGKLWEMRSWVWKIWENKDRLIHCWA